MASARVTITDYMASEHAGLDAILGEVCRLVAENALDQAGTRFREFATGLRRHIHIEEEHVFPLVTPAHSQDRFGPTFVMRMEHIEILEIVAEMESSLDGDGATFTSWLDRLRAVLAIHEMKEAQVLFPEADDRLDDQGRDELLARFRKP